MLNTKGLRFPIDVILLVCIRWYAAYPLSYRHLEEIMQERGGVVDHSSINRWAIQFLPLLKKAFPKHKHAVGTSVSARPSHLDGGMPVAWNRYFAGDQRCGSSSPTRLIGCDGNRSRTSFRYA